MLRKKKRKGGRAGGTQFWDQEYRNAGHLAISDTQSEDLEKFVRWLERETGRANLNVTASALDIGCGNGRNLIWLSRNFGVRGHGYDISEEAIATAKRASADLPLTWSVQKISEPIPVADQSQTLILDMMASHVLSSTERTHFIEELDRVLRPGGYIFFKTFLRDGDRHAERLLQEHPGSEDGTYIHPEIGIPEHVFTVAEIEDLYGRGFTIHKLLKSHRHVKDGKAWKRRSISVYLQKPAY